MRGKESKDGNTEILLVVDAVSNEKGVNKEIIFGALEVALASAAKKRYTGDPDLRVTINRRTGGYETFRRWLVVADPAEIEGPDRQMVLAEARGIQADAQVGGYVEIPLENADFGGRIAAQTAKQVIVQRVRDVGITGDRLPMLGEPEGDVGNDQASFLVPAFLSEHAIAVAESAGGMIEVNGVAGKHVNGSRITIIFCTKYIRQYL